MILYENLINIAKQTNEYYIQYIESIKKKFPDCNDTKILVTKLQQEIASNNISIMYYEKLIKQ